MKRASTTSTGLLASSLAAWVGIAGAAATTSGPWTSVASAQDAKPVEGTDTLVLKDGKTLVGTVVSETATTIRFRRVIAGIPLEEDYARTQVAELKKGTATPTTPATPAVAPAPNGIYREPTAPVILPRSEDAAATQDGKKRIYWIRLEGELGTDITQKPIRDAIKDARNLKADVIVMELDADWKRGDEEGGEPLPNDAANFDEVFRAEDITPIFTQEIRKEWETPPKVVFWVKQAMAGASLLPFVSPDIYFASDARLGGIGNLSIMMDGVGDDVVREKQRSLRLGHVEGWAISGGHDYRFIRAMARIEYVLSVKYENGQPVLIEDFPSNAGEELLTDDGEKGNADSLSARVSGTGNDVLTFNARTAKALGLSRGTADSKDELISALGLDRTGVVLKGRSERIMEDWSEGIDTAKRRLKRLLEEYPRIAPEPPGEYSDRTKARGRRTRALDEIQTILKQRGEGLSPRWRGQNGIPSEDQINTMKEGIKLEQLKDRK